MNKVLANIEQNEKLVKLYQESAKLGASNLGGGMPQLKIHTVNKSMGNLLADGSEPHDGWFFHTQTKQEFRNPQVHVLSISRGFKTEGMVDQKTGVQKPDQFNQILGGIIEEGTDLIPFIMYFNGLKLAPLWSFAKEANQYTHAKPIPTPMFALTVIMSTNKVTHEYGQSSVVGFEIVKLPGGEPERVLDEGKFVFLRDSVLQVEETIEALISSKSTEEGTATSM